MAIEVIKCPVCGMRYNSSYAQCPYCSKGSQTSKPVKERWWGRKNNTSDKNQQAETTSNVLNNSIGGESTSVSNGMTRPQTVNTFSTDPNSTPTDNSVGKTMPIQFFSQNNSMNSPERSEDNEIQSSMTYDPFAAQMTVEESSRRENPIPQDTRTDKEKNPVSLNSRIQDIGKTTAKFISTSSGETIFPVVGWLVCVKGVYYGKSFPLRSGINKVSRSDDSEVSMPRDQSVSSQAVVKIVYDTKGGKFNALPGESSNSLCYINGEAMYERTPLLGYETIELGDSEKNKFVFIPLCGEKFSWSDYDESKASN